MPEALAADGPYGDLAVFAAPGLQRDKRPPAVFFVDGDVRVVEVHRAQLQVPSGEGESERGDTAPHGVGLATEQGPQRGGVLLVQGEAGLAQERGGHAVPLDEQARHAQGDPVGGGEFVRNGKVLLAVER
ncbi:hypothetical protein [Streptomyces sp. enrichment culture]|uniref:hypothetical protein n=1 Tax=Streptomyces sp. enrichment culture TaxID=1795815 RepID=UPI003F57E8BB